MKKFPLFLLIILFFSNCKNNPSLILDINHIPSDKLYLIDAFSHEIIDSAVKSNDKFEFKNLFKTHVDPYCASLMFFNIKDNKEELIPISNKYLSKGKRTFTITAFMIEERNLVINGDYNSSPRIFTIDGGIQNEAMFKNQMSDFGYLGDSQYNKREQKINKYKNIASKFPDSFNLLYWLSAYRTSYSKTELEEITNEFSEDLKASKSFQDIKYYLQNYEQVDGLIKKLSLVDNNGDNSKVFNPNTKLNMMVFWASWCQPCVQEIPTIKEIYSKYKSKNLNLISISIDESEKSWKDALEKYKMDWKQYIVNKNEKTKIKSNLKFSSIPLILFIDKNGKEIKRITGMSASNTDSIKVFLDRQLQLSSN